MKEFIRKIIDIINKPSDEISPFIFIAIFVVVTFLIRNCKPKYVIIFGIIAGLIMLIYTIMSILKRENIVKTLIYFIVMIMSIAIIIVYYLQSKGMNFDVFGIIFPILLESFFITGYMYVKKSRDKERIAKMKIILIVITLILILYMVVFIFA
ncbi:hypothetical protein AGR56_17455 [Clostridium sp. DMHC 10]|uniref:hypothetical protein n=1 Tax=Clostridium sp. DMHC 10 TaxID=747377 RepID=UPI00069F2F15|nr:hypothetical protein [Clostridium sp. DMHC 10]KOF55648.1 hypothetical protein AGR56_17455 [Clostridium sp. DMHC 10]